MNKHSKKTNKKTAKPVKKKLQKRPSPTKGVRKAARKILPRRRTPERPETILPPHIPAAPVEFFKDDRIPEKYHEDRLVLLVRDPWWLYAYWELTPGKREHVEAQARQAGHKNWQTVLRVFDLTPAGKVEDFFDIDLNFFVDNWYIDVGRPGRDWVVELGLKTPSGDFYTLLRSNTVRTPAFGISDVVDEEWMMPEDIYYQLIGLTGPGRQAGGSMDIRKLLEKYLKRAVSSEHRPIVSPLTKK